MAITTNRYLTRLNAMLGMAESEDNGGEAQAAKDRFDKEIKKFAKFGFKSQAEVMLKLKAVSLDVFDDSDFIRFDYDMGGKRIAQWKGFLIAACAMQQQCVALRSVSKGSTVLFGPKSRIENAIWLYEQLLLDLKKNCKQAWDSLSIEAQQNDNMRSFINSYCLAVATAFHRRENEMKCERVKAHYASQRDSNAIVSTQNAIDIKSERFARSECNYKSSKAHTHSRSANGHEAGKNQSSRVSNRRMTGSQRRLGAG